MELSLRSLASEPTRVTSRAYSRAEQLPGAMARLASEDWHEMTAAANASPDHVGSLTRWIKQARATNPELSDDQATRLGRLLKDEFYRDLAARGVAARRARVAVDAA